MISTSSIDAMGKAMANDFIDFMECDPDLYQLLVIKIEQFMSENKMTFDSDLECELTQVIVENIKLTNIK